MIRNRTPLLHKPLFINGLGVIARRRAAETWRENAGRAARELDASRGRDAGLPDVVDEIERAELKRFLADAVMKLDEPLRDVLQRSYRPREAVVGRGLKTHGLERGLE